MDDDRWEDELAAAKGFFWSAIIGSLIWFCAWLVYLLFW